MTKMIATVVLGLCVASAFGAPSKQIVLGAGDCTSDCGACGTEEECRAIGPEDCAWGLKDGPMFDPGEQAEDAYCRKQICADAEAEAQGVNADPSILCENFISPAGTCEFNREYYICWEKDKPLPCEVYYSHDSCQSPCVWHDTVYECLPADEPMSCGLNYDETECGTSSDCSWDPASDSSDYCGVCYLTTKGNAGAAPCSSFFEKGKDCCPSHCQWQANAEVCIDVDEILACDEYHNEDGCNTGDNCRWLGQSYTCVDANRMKCDYFEEEECMDSKTCWWEEAKTTASPFDPIGAACIACTKSNCTQHYVDPNADDGKPCGTHTPFSCPDPRCSVHELDEASSNVEWLCSSGGASEICGNPFCEDMYSDVTCANVTGCTWNSTLWQCVNQSKTVECSQHETVPECSSDSQCSWQTISYPTTCEYPEYEPVGACYNHTESNPRCSELEIFDQACCPSYCTWSEARYQCEDRGATHTCESFAGRTKPANSSDNSVCPTSRCKVEHGVCTTGDITCPDICNEVLCETSPDCHWDSACVAGASSPVTCSTLTIDDCYSHPLCFFDGKCRDIMCPDIYEQDECSAFYPNCTWNEGEGCYYAKETPPCEDFYDNIDCPDTCVWNTDRGSCLDKGESPPCHEYYDENSCPTTTCEWDAQAYSCEAPTSGLPVPTFSGGGVQDASQCTSGDQTNYRVTLDTATVECVDYNSLDTSKATDKQKICLNYYVVTTGKFTIKEVCPCLYYWALHVEPERDAWMMINC